jgi:hypothetical protein
MLILRAYGQELFSNRGKRLIITSNKIRIKLLTKMLSI